MYTWTFTQIEGQGVRKSLELKGWNAPFGRPRKEPIFTEIVKSRVQTTYYPGKTNNPTRHSFGTNQEPIELKGRWMTPNTVRDGGLDANALADVWKTFVRQQRACRMSWGLILSYEVFIEELHLARESEHQIAWKMKVAVDRADDASESASIKPQLSYPKFNAGLEAFLFNTQVLKTPTIPDMSPDFLDQLDNLAGALNAPAAALNRIAGQISDFEKATFSTLQHFRSAITGFEQALVELQNFYLSTQIDSAILVRSADSDTAWVRSQLSLDDEATALRAQLAAADRQAELAAKSELGRFTVAKEGDTWESICRRATGGVDRAGEIRSMNGAQYGELPQVGEIYLTP